MSVPTAASMHFHYRSRKKYADLGLVVGCRLGRRGSLGEDRPLALLDPEAEARPAVFGDDLDAGRPSASLIATRLCVWMLECSLPPRRTAPSPPGDARPAQDGARPRLHLHPEVEWF
jgi:hypothetical protein